MKIATPIITDFDKEDIAPWSGNRLIELHMATLPSKIIKPFIFMPTNKHSLYYQKLRPRFEPMDETTQVACEPLCQEGWYFDCATETCKEYSGYTIVINTRKEYITKVYDWETGYIEGTFEVDSQSLDCDNAELSFSAMPKSWQTESNTIPWGEDYNTVTGSVTSFVTMSSLVKTPLIGCYTTDMLINNGTRKRGFIITTSDHLGFAGDGIPFISPPSQNEVQIHGAEILETFSLYGVK